VLSRSPSVQRRVGDDATDKRMIPGQARDAANLVERLIVTAVSLHGHCPGQFMSTHPKVPWPKRRCGDGWAASQPR
jgi:hypothetical protein